MDKQNVVYSYNRILVSHKNKGVMKHTMACMNLKNIMLREISHIQKETYYMIPFVQNIQKRQIHRDRK